MTYDTCPAPPPLETLIHFIFKSYNSIDIFLYLNPLASFKASTHYTVLRPQPIR